MSSNNRQTVFPGSKQLLTHRIRQKDARGPVQHQTSKTEKTSARDQALVPHEKGRDADKRVTRFPGRTPGSTLEGRGVTPPSLPPLPPPKTDHKQAEIETSGSKPKWGLASNSASQNLVSHSKTSTPDQRSTCVQCVKLDPWITFEKSHSCRQAGDVDIASRRSSPFEIVAIRTSSLSSGTTKLARIDHPHILQLKEIFEHSGKLYCVYQYCQISLKAIQTAGFNHPFRTCELASIAYQALSAIEFVHRTFQRSHGSVSLSSFFVDESTYFLKLADIDRAMFDTEPVPIQSDIQEFEEMLRDLSDIANNPYAKPGNPDVERFLQDNILTTAQLLQSTFIRDRAEPAVLRKRYIRARCFLHDKSHGMVNEG